MQEKETIKLCLKHFRKRNYSSSFKELRERTKVLLESSIVSIIYETLVTKGNFKETERILEENQVKPFDSFLREKRKFSFQVSFNLINNNNSTPINRNSMKKPKKISFRPIGRGGHQMVIDSIIFC